MLIKTFAIANIVLPVFISSIVSKLKVEKVLNPPQNPTTINKRKAGLSPLFSEKYPTANASIMQLIVLEKKVANGSTDLKFDFTISEIP